MDIPTFCTELQQAAWPQRVDSGRSAQNEAPSDAIWRGYFHRRPRQRRERSAAFTWRTLY